MPVVTVDDLFANWKMKLLLYGQSGVGKTRLAGSAALVKELCPIYWFATEKGMLSIRSLMLTGRMQVMIAQSGSDLIALQNVLANPGKIKTIVIDSLSELHALIMQVEMSKKGVDGPPGRQEYRLAHDKILKLLRYIDARAKCHVIATSSDIATVDTENGRILSIDPDLVGKLAFRTARYFDGVYYLRVRRVPSIVPGRPATVTRWLQAQNYDGISAKDRTEGAGVTMEEPTMAKIYTTAVGPCTLLPATRVDDPEVNIEEVPGKEVHVALVSVAATASD